MKRWVFCYIFIKQEVVLHRAESPNEVWQIDFKGPCLLGDKRTNLLIVVDDHSGSLITVDSIAKPTVENTTDNLNRLLFYRKVKPKAFLADNGPRFKEQFREWCRENSILLENAPPHCSEAKGKVEKGIRNLKEEFLRLNQYLDDPNADLKEYVR